MRNRGISSRLRGGGTSSGRGTSWSVEISVGDKDDADEGGKHAEEFAKGEFFGMGAGADEKGPD